MEKEATRLHHVAEITMAAYPSESSPPNSATTNLPAAGNNHRAAWGLGGGFPLLAVGGKGNLTLASHAVGDISKPTDTPATYVREVLMMQGGEGGGSSNPPSPTHNDTDSDAFILDSGANVHATGNCDHFTHLNPIPPPGITVRVANDASLPVVGCGTVRRDNITLHGVLLVAGLAKNIVSVSKLNEVGYNVEFTRTSCFIRDAGTGELVGRGRGVDGLFELDFLQAPRV